MPAIAVGDPDRPFGELEPFRQLPHLRVRRHDRVHRGIQADHVHVHLVRHHAHRTGRATMELELGVMQEDEVGRRLGDRPVDPEQRDLDLLAGLHIAPDHEAVLGIPAHHHRPAALRRGMRQLAVHPHLGVVVDLRLEHDRRSGGVEVAHTLRDRDAQRGTS